MQVIKIDKVRARMLNSWSFHFSLFCGHPSNAHSATISFHFIHTNTTTHKSNQHNTNDENRNEEKSVVLRVCVPTHPQCAHDAVADEQHVCEWARPGGTKAVSRQAVGENEHTRVSHTRYIHTSHIHTHTYTHIHTYTHTHTHTHIHTYTHTHIHTYIHTTHTHTHQSCHCHHWYIWEWSRQVRFMRR